MMLNHVATVGKKKLADKHPDQLASQHMRCDLCYDLQKKDVDDLKLALEFTADQALRVEESKSCDICSLIVEGVRQFEDASWSLGKDVSRVYIYALSNRGDSLTAEVYFHTDRPKLVLEFYHTGEWKPPWEAIRRRSSVTGYPVLTKGVQWVKSTLEQCLNEHASCTIEKESILPKRTLHIERLSSGDVCVKLREHKNERGRYTALSHCWGSQQACTTTSKNLETYKKSVPWEALPATFQDAIIFTLTLGVHHIWIDSLCIIQGYKEDWEVESSRMGNIYQNAYLTLAATAASNGSEGCFSMQSRRTQEFRVHPRNGAESIVVREKIQHWQTRSARATVKDFPLQTRGWVLQERYLSPRTLHFCSDELVWECLEDLTCECGGILADCNPLRRLQLVVNTAEPIDLQPSLSVIDESGQTFDQNVSFQNSNSEVSAWNEAESESDGWTSDSPSLDAAHGDMVSLSPPSYEEMTQEQQAKLHLEQISDQWHSIVEQYTPLKLSKETDRLPALSGLAMLASSVLGTYSCGLWLKTIAKDLMWRVPLLELGYSKPTHFTGPSWSWASVNGQVAYWNDLDDHVEDDDIERLRNEMNTLETWYEREEAKKALRWRLQERAARQQKTLELQASCEVTLTGENPFGEVKTGRLKIRGSVRNARLLYVNSYGSANLTHVETHDPLRYQLGIQTTRGLSDFLDLSDSFDLELPFFADYNLSEGTDRVPEDTLVTLFNLRQNVCLVLTGGPHEYRRIGIVRQSSGYQRLYGLDWMLGATVEIVTIV
ncbi:hypothetical protein OPT61_g4899 [Boeremia exigua]|uniref:Uncharacterized protein n=1 Tax=Boeremia exigua TaxID=749465 RepID=A0ACC2ICF8_9PLEO|nr:hypothetical protein OPT61_g4899 [Boeremia exigua]